jgi:hypothetical protein
VRLLEAKACSCGKVHEVVALDTKTLFDDELEGYYWECSCGSTLFAKFDELELEVLAA